MIALRDAGVAPGHPALRARRRVAARARRSACRGDWAVRRPRARARRLGVRVRERPLPRHRRHRRGDPRAARRARAGADARRRGGDRARRRAGRSACSRRDGGFAALRRRQHARAVPRAALLRLRRGDRSAAAPTSPRTCVEMLALEGSARTTRACAARVAWLLARAGAGRLVVRALGREPRLRHGRRGAGAGRRGRAARRTPRSAAPCAGSRAYQNADGGCGEDLRSYVDRRLARAAGLDRLADGLGAARAARGGRALAGGRARRRRGSRDAARGRRLGRAASSPAPASPATSTSTTTSTAWSSR